MLTDGGSTRRRLFASRGGMINIWRAMRGELTLLQYTMENVVWHLLHRPDPSLLVQEPDGVVYTNGRAADLDKVLRYHTIRTRLDMEILETNELIARTSEQARLLGVDFFSVFSRGSQFKVESIMFRIRRNPRNFHARVPEHRGSRLVARTRWQVSAAGDGPARVPSTRVRCWSSNT